MAIGVIGGPIGTPIGGVINASGGTTFSDAAGLANIDFSVSAVLDAIGDQVGNAAIDISCSGTADALGDTIGSANIDFSVSGIASSSRAEPPIATAGGVGRPAWRDHYEPYYKKRKKELEALNEALLELRAKVTEQKIAEKAAAERNQLKSWIDGLRSAEVFLANAAANEVTLNAIANELARVHEALQEIEDEESIVLLLH